MTKKQLIENIEKYLADADKIEEYDVDDNINFREDANELLEETLVYLRVDSSPFITNWRRESAMPPKTATEE